MKKIFKNSSIFVITVELILLAFILNQVETKNEPETSYLISKNDLLNTKYEIDYDTVQLKDGYYFDDFGDDWVSTKLEVKIASIALGDLNGDNIDDAAVVLWSHYGGSGVFYWLFAMINEKGNLKQTDYISLGDRVRLNSMTIKERTIILDIIVHDENDGACCPSLRKIQKFELIDQLKKIE